MALKSTTQGVIVGKLSGYPRENRTKPALWEPDSIISTLYLLDYIDSPALRRNGQRALNSGEAYHQRRRASAYAHGGRFRARSQHKQEVSNECARFVGNAIVYYNSLILSEALTELEEVPPVTVELRGFSDACGYSATVARARIPSGLSVQGLARRLRCTACGSRETGMRIICTGASGQLKILPDLTRKEPV